MDLALGWIGKLFEFFGSLFPRLLIVEATHGGVIFIRGKNIKTISAGLHLYWPFWSKVALLPTVRQPVNLPTQALTTKDGKRVVVGGIVRFRIGSITRAITKTWDLDQIIVDESLGVFSDYITSQDFLTVQNDRPKVAKELTEKLKEKLSYYGVLPIEAKLTDFCQCITLNHVGNWMSARAGEE